jgi:hypothetical protein
MKNKEKEQEIQELKKAMQFEEENNFPNGDLWNNLSDKLYELQKVPTTFEILTAILNSPKDFS